MMIRKKIKYTNIIFIGNQAGLMGSAERSGFDRGEALFGSERVCLRRGA